MLLKRLDSPWFAVAVICAGVLLRIAVLISLAQFPLGSDSLAYHEMAIAILHKETFSLFYPPGLPYVLASVYALVGESELIGRATGLIWYAGFSVLLFQLSSTLFTRMAANLAVLTFALFPTFVWQSSEPLTQLPTATCLLAICLVTLRTRRNPTWWKSALLGALLGLVVLMRPSTLLLAAFIPAYLLATMKRRRFAVVPFVLFSVILCGWLISAHKMTGRFVMISETNAVNFFYGNNPYTPLYKTWWFGSHGEGDKDVPAEFTALLKDIQSEPKQLQAGRFRALAANHILSRPDLFILRSVNRMRTYFAFDTIAGTSIRKLYGVSTPGMLTVIGLDALFYCLVLFSCVLFLFTRSGITTTPGDVRLVLLIVFLYSVPYWFSFSHPTYHVPVLPFLAMFGASFVVQFASAARQTLLAPIVTSPRRRYGLMAVLLLCVFIQIEWIAFGMSRI